MALAFDSHGSGPAARAPARHRQPARQCGIPWSDALARERRVIAVDLPGFARLAAGGLRAHRRRASRRCLERWFAEQGLDRPHVAGNSMGGGIALELARRGAVASATAVSPIGFWTARELAFAQHSLRASRAIVKRLRPAVPALTAHGRPGASRSSRRSIGRPWRMSPADAVATIDAFLDAPAFERRAEGLQALPLRARATSCAACR